MLIGANTAPSLFAAIKRARNAGPLDNSARRIDERCLPSAIDKVRDTSDSARLLVFVISTP